MRPLRELYARLLQLSVVTVYLLGPSSPLHAANRVPLAQISPFHLRCENMLLGRNDKITLRIDTLKATIFVEKEGGEAIVEHKLINYIAYYEPSSDEFGKVVMGVHLYNFEWNNGYLMSNSDGWYYDPVRDGGVVYKCL